MSAKTNDPALDPAPVLQPLGAKHADDARIFQGIPGLERAPNGRLWATWYSGGRGEGPENFVTLVTSGDDGATWSSLKLAIDPPGDVRAFDPCLWCDPMGRLWFFWAQGYSWWDGRAGVWAIVTEDPGDEDPAWSAPRRLCSGIMMNKPTVLSTGEWLLPAAVWEIEPNSREERRFDLGNEKRPNVVCSTDRGETWSLLGGPVLADRNCDEHMLVERRDGRLWMLVRTQYGVGESFSSDGGRTYSPGRRSETVTHIPHARFFIRRLASGKLLLVKHEPCDGKSRSHLMATLSDDDGETWEGGLLLDERGGVSYPDGVQAPDGRIYMIYDFDRTGAKEILMAVFTEEDVARGECVSDRARLRVLINRATGVHPKHR
ncbi:MAG: exo-alpha-sialidase [Planctomycetes bacterium]|nr:exo-alpha-sialidase [Planctomycetota bacterium]